MLIRLSEVLGPTIQGEGILTGCPSMFVRVQGCSLQCAQCDTKHSWSRQSKLTPLDDVKKCLQKHPRIDVVITGGEPLDDDHIVAVEELAQWAYHRGRRVTVETSGQYTRQQRLPRQLLKIVYLWSVSPKLPAMGFDKPQANPFFASHVAAAGRHTQLKFVVSPQTLDQDLEMVRLYLDLYDVQITYPAVRLLFQVATQTDAAPADIKEQILADWAILVQRILKVSWLQQYRPQVLPQAHRLIGVD